MLYDVNGLVFNFLCFFPFSIFFEGLFQPFKHFQGHIIHPRTLDQFLLPYPLSMLIIFIFLISVSNVSSHFLSCDHYWNIPLCSQYGIPFISPTSSRIFVFISDLLLLDQYLPKLSWIRSESGCLSIPVFAASKRTHVKFRIKFLETLPTKQVFSGLFAYCGLV